MRRLAVVLLAVFAAGVCVGYRRGWRSGADFVEAWAATEADCIADLCEVLGCTPREFRQLLAESCVRIDAGERVN